MLFLVYLEDIADNMPIREPLLKEHMAHVGRHIGSIMMAGLWPHIRIHAFKDLINSWQQPGCA